MNRVAVAAVCLGLLAGLTACAGESDPAGSSIPTAGRSGPLPGGKTASCVESYAPKAVAGRAFAFDGVVVAVGRSVSDRGDDADLGLQGVTFEVREWFSGSRADTVTVDLQAPGSAYGVGSRLLVSGEARWGGSPLDAPIAWGCGFSRYHDPETAKAWRDAVRR